MRRLITFFVLIVVFATSSLAHDFEVDGIYYVINSDGTSVRVSYDDQYLNEYEGSVIIPPTVTYSNTTYSVTSIGNNAFRYCSYLASVTIPNSITSIGDNAFGECGLSSIEIPNSVTSIGLEAFYNCIFLYSLTIPNSVTEIGSRAFYGSAWFDKQPDGLVYAGKVAYEYKGTMPSGTSLTIKEGTVSISYSCFSGCSGLTSVTIPNSVTSIGDFAFSGCSGLTSVTIPNSVTSIFGSSFSSCNNLTSIVVESGNTTYDSRNNCNAIIKTSNNELICGCKNTEIPNSVTSIGGFAFYNCSGLTSIEIPNSVTSIGDLAFSGCSGLTSIEIPNSVTVIGGSAFYGCSGLTSIDIPNSVTSIGGFAFYNCRGLKSVTIPNSVTSIGERAFFGCSGLMSIIVEAGNAVYDSRNNCNAIIETSTNSLLVGCENTEIPNSVTSIGHRAFFGCSGLTSIDIPNSVTEIGANAFQDCTSLTSVTIGNFVSKISSDAFRGCSDLKSMTIPNSVTWLGSSAFRDCSGLTSVTIGNSVTWIGSLVFSGCGGLTSVTNFASNPQTISSDVFSQVDVSSCLLFVPAESVSAYQAANVWKNFRVRAISAVPAKPSFSPEPGTYYKVVNISITSETSGAEIHVTFRGETPTADSFLLTKELTLTKSYTVKAVAIKDGVSSEVVTGEYIITDEPIIEPDQFVFTKVMETTDDMVASSNGRFSTGYDNAVFVTDKSAGIIYKYDESGNRSEFTSSLPSGIGAAITSDDAGNILIQNGWAGAGGAKNWIIIEPDETRYDLTLDYDNSGVNAARLDASGRIVGNVLSQEGAYWCLLPGNGTNGAVIKLANGEQVSITPVESGITADYTAIAQPVFSGVSDYDEDPTSGWAFRKRGNGSITRDVARSYSDGFDIFKLGENTYTVEPIGTNYCDGYAIFQDGVAEPVAVKEETISSGSQRFQSLTARVSEDGTYATIYQNVSGYCASIYQFGMPPTGVDKVSASEDANIVSTAYYNLQGVRVMNPTAGQILIKVNTLSNGQIRASKISVK